MFSYLHIKNHTLIKKSLYSKKIFLLSNILVLLKTVTIKAPRKKDTSISRRSYSRFYARQTDTEQLSQNIKTHRKHKGGNIWTYIYIRKDIHVWFIHTLCIRWVLQESILREDSLVWWWLKSYFESTWATSIGTK